MQGASVVRPEDPRHGTTRGYDAHLRANQKACPDCRAAAAAYEYRRRIDGILGRVRTVPSEGTARRIQALVALGYTFGQIGGALDRSQDWAAKLAHRRESIVRTDTAERVESLYRRWSMTPAPTTTSREHRAASYARSTARKHGWVPPLAWDDIDDPNEQPSGATNVERTPYAERTWDTTDHRACPRCGVVRRVYVGASRKPGLCADCYSLEQMGAA